MVFNKKISYIVSDKILEAIIRSLIFIAIPYHRTIITHTNTIPFRIEIIRLFINFAIYSKPETKGKHIFPHPANA